ncbi:MAG: peptidoglycan editing factor PgeF [Lachnospiraceae bacterium]|nr:peptidoglycan editing factor PgeF [Lachnospiraceae bacterium]
MIQFVRKEGADPMRVCQYKKITYLTFPLLEETGLVRHLFSTREGGVSKGIYASMNLSYSRGDEKEAVDENFRRIAEIFDSTPERMVCSRQTHTTNIRVVTEADCGKGTVRETDYEDVDGLITDIPDIILGTFYADCVPLYFVDKKNKAIGLAHSGWRGTVNRMGEQVLRKMKKAYGTQPKDVVAAVGPSICQDCYEVGGEVAEAFWELAIGEWKSILKEGKEKGKYQLDLQKANQQILINAGVPEEQIAVSDICTCCNSKFMFSHRASHGKRGNLGAFMELRKS